MQSGDERWPLDSGEWRRDAASGRWTLAISPAGRKVSGLLSAADLHALVGASSSDSAPTGAGEPRYFPPEFFYCPDTGRELVRARAPMSAPWLPPYGATPGTRQYEQYGLRQTRFGLRPRLPAPGPDADATLRANEPPQHHMPLPPPGRYEFCAARFGARCDVLVGLQPDKGMVHAWLPEERAWKPVTHAAGGRLADASLADSEWKPELVQHDAATTLYLPTVAGLAQVRIDVLSLTFEASYVGAGAVLGAPVSWSDEVWAPVRQTASGTPLLVSASGREMAVELPPTVQRFAPPVCDEREIIWPAREGQLRVRKQPDGALETSWLAWPPGIEPRFEFGCPYLSRSGSFWQCAWEDAAGCYLYVQMGVSAADGPDRRALTSPRFCTGSLSYERGRLIKDPPWSEPETAADPRQSTVIVLPLIESAHHSGVLGWVIETTRSATEVLASKDAQVAWLQYQGDDPPDLRFFTLRVGQPWRTRVFVFGGRLWIYHPEQPDLHGWDLGG